MKIGELVKVINHVNDKGEIIYRTCSGTVGILLEIRQYTTKTNVVIEVQTLVDDKGVTTDYSNKTKEERNLELTITDIAPVSGDSKLPEVKKGMAVKLNNDKGIYIVSSVKDYSVETTNYVTGEPKKISIYSIQKIIPAPQLSSDWFVRVSKKDPSKYLCSNLKYVGLTRKYIDKDNFVANHHELFKWFKLEKAKLAKKSTGSFVKEMTSKTYKYGKIVQTKTMSNVHETGGWFSELLATKYVDLMLSKYSQKFEPVCVVNNYIGAEVECFTLLSHEKLAIHLAKRGLHKHCRITGDGSINADSGHTAVEIRLLAKESEYADIVKKLFAALSEDNVKAKVNNSCGLHVHFDMRNRKVDKTYENLMCMLRLVRMAIPSHRRENSYCKTPSSPFYTEQLKQAQHYDAISLTAYKKQKTIEVRLLEGTLDVDTLNNWIKLWIDLINLDVIDRNYTTVEAFLKDFPDFDVEFLKNRIAKYK